MSINARAGGTALILPDWPAPPNVRALVTTRAGGVSAPPCDSFNLGERSGDDPAAVAANRAHLRQLLPGEPVWLHQVHGTRVVRLPTDPDQQADAAWSTQPGSPCLVLTADCLPVLFCDRQGTRVAAAHAGWRGLADGVLEATVQALGVTPGELLAWLGPAIGQDAFEVGPEVRAAFLARDPAAAEAFRAGREDRWHADLYLLARQRLAAAGVDRVSGG
ncbi:MAG: peptidoglycan editing factor PgeF, partial [Pseudomonadota bacterium]|nr:peptidoglycan editing factor PgeF [Pseudomonadota bacterium]